MTDRVDGWPIKRDYGYALNAFNAFSRDAELMSCVVKVCVNGLPGFSEDAPTPKGYGPCHHPVVATFWRRGVAADDETTTNASLLGVLVYGIRRPYGVKGV